MIQQMFFAGRLARVKQGFDVVTVLAVRRVETFTRPERVAMLARLAMRISAGRP